MCKTQSTSGMLAVVREMQHGFFFFWGGKREGEARNDKTQGESVPKSPGKRRKRLGRGLWAGRNVRKDNF